MFCEVTFTKKISFFEYAAVFAAVFFIGIIISAPAVCAAGGIAGIKICANVLIPSLFPFAVPVLFIINTHFFKCSKHRVALLFLLSLTGGYPVGAKLIYELYKNGNISKNKAQRILPFCVNAGPAFIVTAVGKVILKSAKVGYILLGAHLLSAITMALIFIRKDILTRDPHTEKYEKISITDNLVLSVHNASKACISISAFVIIFSVINEYITYFSAVLKQLQSIEYFTEVTAAISKTKNVYFISFLLGFAGISIWLQIYSVSGEIKPHLATFAAVRIIHGALSTLSSFGLFKLFKITVVTFSNQQRITEKAFYSDYAVTISLLIMAIVLLININSKKHSGNFIDDML